MDKSESAPNFSAVTVPNRTRSARLLFARPQKSLPVWIHLLNILSNRLLALAQRINLRSRQRIGNQQGIGLGGRQGRRI